jgi:hypothetical protein
MISAEFAIFIISLLTAVCVAIATMIHFAIKRLDRMQALYMSTLGTLIYMVAEQRGDLDEDDPTDEEDRPGNNDNVLPFRNGSGEGGDDKEPA